MKSIFACCLISAALVLTFGPGAQAQPAAEGTDPAAAVSADDFDGLFAEWKELLTQMRELQAKYPITKPEERPALVEAYDALIARGDELLPKLSAGAEAVYRQSPGEDEDLADFLASLVIEHVNNTENYEEGYRVSQLLAENDYPRAQLYNLAGIAAFATGHFEQAIDYFNRAKEGEKLDQTGERYLNDSQQYIELGKREEEIRAAEAEADDLPRVLMKTSKGDMVIELFENEAPNTVANFIHLVEQGFYDGLTFHRVLKGFMAQGGCPKGDGSGGPGYSIRCECVNENHRNHFRGSLSMAHAGRDTGGSQFFLTFVPTAHLNGQHTVFGRVIEGIDVLSKLQRRDPNSASPPEPDQIVEATVLRKRDHEYTPETIPAR